MNSKTILVFAGLALLLAAAFASAAEFSAAAEKTVFARGEEARVSVTVKNDAAQAKNFFVEVNVVGRAPENALPPAPKRMRVSLDAGEEKTVKLTLLFVDEGVPPGDYEARVRLLEGEAVVSEASAAFRVEGTLARTPDYRVFACKDEACSQPSIVHYRCSRVFVATVPKLEGFAVTAQVKTPDGVQSLALPASLTASAAGVYEVTATASKEGHAPKTFSFSFNVLEKPVTLVEERQAAERKATAKPEEKPLAQQGDYALIGIAVAAIVVLVLLFAWLSKGKAKKR
jgi:hypothetical protein